mmetsp:Transcript_67283/g.145180  ORF Transcript_67283/g.145180 Transcript_67283/m.145180 type:complete len:364 (+) Transcript_67283:824-1915(+)
MGRVRVGSGVQADIRVGESVQPLNDHAHTGNPSALSTVRVADSLAARTGGLHQKRHPAGHQSVSGAWLGFLGRARHPAVQPAALVQDECVGRVGPQQQHPVLCSRCGRPAFRRSRPLGRLLGRTRERQGPPRLEVDAQTALPLQRQRGVRTQPGAGRHPPRGLRPQGHGQVGLIRQLQRVVRKETQPRPDQHQNAPPRLVRGGHRPRGKHPRVDPDLPQEDAQGNQLRPEHRNRVGPGPVQLGVGAHQRQHLRPERIPGQPQEQCGRRPQLQGRAHPPQESARPRRGARLAQGEGGRARGPHAGRHPSAPRSPGQSPDVSRRHLCGVGHDCLLLQTHRQSKKMIKRESVKLYRDFWIQLNKIN